MEHKLYDKTDKQLLKRTKVDLVDYIRTLEDTLSIVEDATDNTTDNTTGLLRDGLRHKLLTSYSFDGSIEEPKELYSF